MVEFTLPRNSKVGKGKVHHRPDGASRLREFRIYRYDPEDGANQRVDTYFVDRDDCAGRRNLPPSSQQSVSASSSSGSVSF